MSARQTSASGAAAPWSLVYRGFVPAEEGRREALCTLGNGYLATRGAAPESRADEIHYPGAYAAGVYNRLRDTVEGEVIENESLVNLPNWLFLTFRVDGGPWFRLDAVEVLEHAQELDMRRGVLNRTTRFRDAAGRVTRLTQTRFVHAGRPHLAGLRTSITPEDWSGALTVRSALDGAVANTGVPRYRALSGGHLRTLRAEPAGADTALLVVETTQSNIRVAQAARTTLARQDGQPPAAQRTLAAGPDLIGHDLFIEVSPGGTFTIDKVVATYTSRDRAISEPARAACEHLARSGGFDGLLRAHVREWARLWRRCWIDVNGSDLLAAVRLHLFHVVQTASTHTVDIDAGVPARGLHGEAYRGHVLWDELFVFPILNLRLPLVAQALLSYRHRRLEAARELARRSGYSGAMFPWQSGSDGWEESQRRHLNPLSGRWLPDVSHRQRHVSLAIAYNVWQYHQATADDWFLGHYGAEMILDIARFWSSAAEFDPRRGRFVIRGVMGPDEFHTGYPGGPETGIDNNAYTNVMASWVLRRALDTLDMLPDRRAEELVDALSLEAEELIRWREVARGLHVPFHSDGIISQFEGYEGLAELDWAAYRGRYRDIRRLDRILESERDTPNRYKASKQADVLMLFYLLSADELAEVLEHLGYAFDPALIPRTIDYYLARTSHGSTLSAVVHAWVLARAHRHRALEYFVEALRSDIADIQGGTTGEGVHLAAMAGSVDVLQRCFAGVEVRGDTLHLNPYWPAELGALEFTIRYRGHVLTLRVAGRRIRVSASGGVRTPVRLCCMGGFTQLAPGQEVVLELPGQA